MFHYVVEHMEEDDEQTKALPEWVKLEYAHMLTLVAPSQVHFTSLSSTSIPPLRTYLPQAHTHSESIMEVLRQTNQSPAKVCLLDPKAEKVLAPEDAEKFEWFLYGGILGDDPPRDRTAELRKLGFEGRHLGEKQMTTDTAVGVTKMVVEDGLPLDKIPFIDTPTITFSPQESIEMPFRYVEREGEPVLPPGMREHLKRDLDRTIDDF